jgi:hypothetical protein
MYTCDESLSLSRQILPEFGAAENMPLEDLKLDKPN